jgi:hypothetical protein
MRRYEEAGSDHFLTRSRRTPGTAGRRSTGESGQALLELALITPILVLLVMAIFQFAFVIQSQMGLTNAVREAARRAAATPEAAPNWAALSTWAEGELCGDATAPCDAGLLEQNVPAFSAALLPADPTITYCTYAIAGSSGTLTNYQINIAVQYQHPLFFGLLAFATDAIDGTPNGRWDLSAAAQMRLESLDFTDPSFTAPPITGAC